ncbi:MAG: DUF262 domain-containing HNH endonuclease family protein [Chloroflexi bacterium]|nr:DUF262 domain-containing HNH endonuclease family protein [Chloroflexota bacterium]
MKADAQDIRSIFSNAGDVQYRLPRFQRAYAWEKEQWNTLWKDLLRIHAYSLHNSEHFMGAMVVVDDGERHGAMSVLSLVDGQQRLLTISILLLVMRNQCNNEKLREDISMFLVNPRRDGNLHFKVLPTDLYDDQATWKSLISDQPVCSEKSLITNSYDFYVKKVQSFAKRGDADIESLFTTVLEKMMFVYINLGRDERPHQIFESLNAKNVQLTLPDLVRNFVAMQLPETGVRDVFGHYWLPIEELLDERRVIARNRGELTYFLRHYLAMSGELPSFDRIYSLFCDRIDQSKEQNINGFQSEMETLLHYAKHYNCILRPDNEEDPYIRDQLHRLNTLKQTTHYPYLLALYLSYSTGVVDSDRFLNILKLLENYLVRYFLAAEPTNRLNKLFPSLCSEIAHSGDIQSIQSYLLARYYPSDKRILELLRHRNIFSSRNRSQLVFILNEINRHLSTGSDGETVLMGEPTIEHIMPQKLSKAWQKSLGDDFQQVHNEHLNQLGNLTLVTQGWNTQMSNSVFSEKRRKLSRHALLINSQYFNGTEHWNSESIHARTEWLVDCICKIWPSFGYRRSMDDWTRTWPTGLSIYGESIRLKSHGWRNIAVALAEYIVGNTSAFETLEEERFSFLRRHLPESVRVESYRQLSNGWWLYVQLDANNHLRNCETLAELAGLSTRDWDIEFYHY